MHLLFATAVVVLAAWFAIYQNHTLFEQTLRSDVLKSVSLVRAKLEGKVNANIQLVRGLVASIETNPDITSAEFDALVGNLLAQDTQIRHIAAAPDLVVRYIHPLEGNKDALGLDYRENLSQRDAVLRARDTGEMVLAGPVDLVQGGQGFIGRFPVFTRDAQGERTFWGIVSAIIDVHQLYSRSGLFDRNLPFTFALAGRDASGEGGERFFGPASVFLNDPVTAEIVLPDGTWQIAAIPEGGWEMPAARLWRLYGWLAAAAALILLPTFAMGKLMDERARNFVELRDRKLQLERLSRRLRLALQTSRIGIWEMEQKTGELFWDDRMNELYDFPADSRPRNYTHWSRRLHSEDRVRAEADFAQALNETGHYSSEFRLVMEDDSMRHIRAIGAVYQDGDRRRRIVGVNWDVTEDVERNEALHLAKLMAEARNQELEAVRERIEFNALHDSLTGLPNRRYLDDVLAGHARNFAAGNEVAAILHIDLDRFKHINDTLGHAAGDAMLVHTAEILRRVVNKTDFVARIGGDEFVIVRCAPNAASLGLEELADLAALTMIKLQTPMPFDGHECRIGASIGIAADTDEVADPARLLVNADIALYRAKRNGRNGYQFFTNALHAEIMTTKQRGDEIMAGLERGEFEAFYQPQFDARTLEIVGVEALARWNHPQKGLLAPHHFLKIAEELGTVGRLDELILQQTVAQLDLWKDAGLDIPQAAVNVSARRLRGDDLMSSLAGIEVPPHRLSFELVESIFLDEHDDMLAANVDALKERGIDIEIDDFGTGYASIVSLLRLKPKRLKIDRQLVMPVVRAPAQRNLLGSIIEMGHALGIEVLAEGVETMEHAAILRQLGCDALQGYAFARPMAAGDLLAFAQNRKLRQAS